MRDICCACKSLLTHSAVLVLGRIAALLMAVHETFAERYVFSASHVYFDRPSATQTTLIKHQKRNHNIEPSASSIRSARNNDDDGSPDSYHSSLDGSEDERMPPKQAARSMHRMLPVT